MGRTLEQTMNSNWHSFTSTAMGCYLTLFTWQKHAKKTTTFFKNTILTAFFSCLILSNAQAAESLWTFVPQTPTDISAAKGGSAQVIYTVQNKSSIAKILVMKPISGVSQGTPCKLSANGSCTLTLNINGSTLQGDVLGGPVLCQQGNDLQCYQPSSANLLHIRLTTSPPMQQFTVTPTTGANGSIFSETAEVVNAGSTLTYTATSDTGFGVNQWLLDGKVAQTGGTIFQLNNIQANHAIEVTFSQATLSPHAQNLTLSIFDPELLVGNERIIRIENTGSIPTKNVYAYVNRSKFPAKTEISSDTCRGVLNVGDTCDITITPGGNASVDAKNNACTKAPGTKPVPTTVTIIADNASSTDVSVLVLGYGCIYQGGLLFSVDDSTLNTGSIGGKVAAITDQSTGTLWGLSGPVGGISETSTANNAASCDGKNDGACNTDRIIAAGLTPPVAAQLCRDLVSDGFTDWYMPAICEMGRTVNRDSGIDAGCGIVNPNLSTNLYINSLGGIAHDNYWSSTEYSRDPAIGVWSQFFDNYQGGYDRRNLSYRVRCVRAFIP